MKIGIIAVEGRPKMKGLLVSFVVGLFVGVAYGLIRVKSPALPIVALIGLLGMVLGEQAGVSLLAKKSRDTNVSSAYILSEPKDRQERPNMQSVISAVNPRSLP
jgi:XapX domain-containing protein